MRARSETGISIAVPNYTSVSEEHALSSSAMVMKMQNKWNIQSRILIGQNTANNAMMKSPLRVNQCFRGTCHLHHQGPKVSQAKDQREAGKKAATSLVYSSTLKMRAIYSFSMEYTALYPRRHNSS
jgi:hypothetical protein